MFELTFLGTGASVPMPKRGLSSAMVMHDEHRFMVDCGEGTQRQLMTSGLGFRRLNHILITHPHLDHFYGVGGIVSTLMQMDIIDSLSIYGGKSALDKIEDLIFRVVLRGAKPPMMLKLIDVKPGLIFKGDDFDIVAFPVRHRGPDCYGYLFQSHSRRPFLAEKASALGVPNGPERKLLVQGKPITLADGRIVAPEEVMGEIQRGVKLVMTGDLGSTDGLVQIAHDADAIVTEATYTQEDKDLARQNGHLTAAQAAQFAHDANARQLLLTHISGRQPERVILDEAKAIFENTTVVRDFDTYKILREA
jgi:ribonuclease Z